MYGPRTILLLQKAVQEGDYSVFKQYSALVDFADKPHTLRGLLDFRFDEKGGIPLTRWSRWSPLCAASVWGP